MDETAGTYKAAVAQHRTIGKFVPGEKGGNSADIVAKNLEIYKKIAEEAKNEGAQIIVFPEWGLYGWVKSLFGLSEMSPAKSRELIRPFSEEIGCTSGDNLLLQDETSQLFRLAQIAKNCEIVIVANLSELAEKEQDSIFNTEVAISEEGVLLAKYRKMNPYHTKTFNKPEKEIVTFKTNFDVLFGLFVCKDMFHSEPVDSLLALEGKEKVRHFPYSVAVPGRFAAAVLFPRWSRSKNATLLASNLGDGGSRICGPGVTVEKKESGKGTYALATIAI